MENAQVGQVFNIQRFSVQDGPGVRTLVFLKGCPLSCLWCCNPESQAVQPVILYQKNRCMHCQTCVAVCGKGAVSRDGNLQRIDATLCDLCGKCVENCYAGALEMSGKAWTAQEVFQEVEEDCALYANSGGGITLSGGEPFMQPDFAQAIFEICKENGINTAVETCGCVPWKFIERSLPYVDVFLYDIKQMDSQTHQKYTGVGNELILENLRRLAERGKRTVIRLPIIPGVNDSMEHIRSVIAFMKQNGFGEANILPFHKFGLNKYESMFKEYWFKDAKSIPDELLEEMQRAFEEENIFVRLFKH